MDSTANRLGAAPSVSKTKGARIYVKNKSNFIMTYELRVVVVWKSKRISDLLKLTVMSRRSLYHFNFLKLWKPIYFWA